MGTFTVEIEVGAPQGQRYERVTALADTGASYLVLPRPLVASLGLTPLERRSFTLADGRKAEYEVGIVSLRLDGRALPVLCVLGDEGTPPLLGAVALETFGLAVDPVGKRLVSVPGLLMAATPARDISFSDGYN